MKIANNQNLKKTTLIEKSPKIIKKSNRDRGKRIYKKSLNPVNYPKDQNLTFGSLLKNQLLKPTLPGDTIETYTQNCILLMWAL